jgi:hypothetical protein
MLTGGEIPTSVKLYSTPVKFPTSLREIVQQSGTRWACRWKSVQAVMLQYSAILSALEKLSDPAERQAVIAAGLMKHVYI